MSVPVAVNLGQTEGQLWKFYAEFKNVHKNSLTSTYGFITLEGKNIWTHALFVGSKVKAPYDVSSKAIRNKAVKKNI